MKVLTVNMDLSHEQVFSETMKDFFLINCHKKQRDEIIQEGKNKIQNKLNFYSDLELIFKELDKIDVNLPEVFYYKISHFFYKKSN